MAWVRLHATTLEAFVYALSNGNHLKYFRAVACRLRPSELESV
jgi:hypothetical protein